MSKIKPPVLGGATEAELRDLIKQREEREARHHAIPGFTDARHRDNSEEALDPEEEREAVARSIVEWLRVLPIDEAAEKFLGIIDGLVESSKSQPEPEIRRGRCKLDPNQLFDALAAVELDGTRDDSTRKKAQAARRLLGLSRPPGRPTK